MSDSRVKVLVVDDSALMRKLIPQILARDPAIEVVGTAMDGSFGLKKIEELKPDVVTLDLDMPRMDGMEMLRQITRTYQVPVIVVSSLTTQGASATFKALALGAFDFLPKPRDAAQSQMEEISAELIDKVKIAAQTGVPRQRLALPQEGFRAKKPANRAKKAPTKVVAIGISTGGPNALQHLFSQLPSEFSGAIVVVQHMPEGFTEMFSRRLDECCAIDVKEARSGDMLIAGRALICPGNRHIRVRRMPMGDMVVLGDEEKVNGHRPSVDILFRSMASEYGDKCVGLLMTGMGEDGADALGLIKSAGGLTVVQDERSSVVFGMPKAAIERGHAMRVVALEALPNLLMRQCAAPASVEKRTAVTAQT